MEFNKLYNDDCFNVFPSIPKKSIDLVLVDLPYGQTDCEWDVEIDLKLMWETLKRICKDNCQYVFFTTTKFGYKLIHSNQSWFKYDLVWEKCHTVGFLNANRMPLRSHEMIYIFNQSKQAKIKFDRTYNPQKTPGKPYKAKQKENRALNYGKMKENVLDNTTGDRHPKSIINFHQSDEKLHPTQKPSDLCEWLIKTYSNENDVVLDFCMGSGSSIIGCIKSNRKYIGIEKDKSIFEVAQKRINDHQNIIFDV